MTIEVELLKAEHTDAHNERFTEAALKAIADELAAHPEKLKAIPISKSFDPWEAPIGHPVSVSYRDKALWVTIDGEAEKLAATGLEAAAGGMCECSTAGEHRKPGAEPFVIEGFTLNQIAMVKDKVK